MVLICLISAMSLPPQRLPNHPAAAISANCCLSHWRLQRPLAFPPGEGAPVRTLGRKRNGDIWDDICTKTGQIMSKYGALSRTAPIIYRYRRSSSVSLRSTASPRGKPRRFAQTHLQTTIYMLTNAERKDGRRPPNKSNILRRRRDVNGGMGFSVKCTREYSLICTILRVEKSKTL